MDYGQQFLEKATTPDHYTDEKGRLRTSYTLTAEDMATLKSILRLEGKLEEIEWSLGKNSQRYDGIEKRIKILMK